MDLCRTMRWADHQIPEYARWISELGHTSSVCRSRGLRFCTWWGTFDDAHRADTAKNKGDRYHPWPCTAESEDLPWFALWQYAHVGVAIGIGAVRGAVILDIGGSCSLLNLTLARLGARVVVVDRSPAAAKAIAAASRIARWTIACAKHEISGDPKWVDAVAVDLGGQRPDAIVSVSCLHVLDQPSRAQIARLIGMVARDTARVIATFDYANPNPKKRIAVGNSLNLRGWRRTNDFVDCLERQLVYYPDPSRGKYTMAGVVWYRCGSES